MANVTSSVENLNCSDPEDKGSRNCFPNIIASLAKVWLSMSLLYILGCPKYVTWGTIAKAFISLISIFQHAFGWKKSNLSWIRMVSDCGASYPDDRFHSAHAMGSFERLGAPGGRVRREKREKKSRAGRYLAWKKKKKRRTSPRKPPRVYEILWFIRCSPCRFPPECQSFFFVFGWRLRTSLIV